MVRWNNNELCDAGFLINLKEREDRLNDSYDTFKMIGLEGIERFEACKIDAEFCKYGCSQSHLEIAKMQISNQWDYVLYLEDDVCLDFFYAYDINPQKIDQKKVVDEIISDFKKNKPDVLWLGVRPEEYCEKITNTTVKPKKTLMSHAYIGSLKYANFLVDHYKYYSYEHFSHRWPIDFFMSQINVKDDWKVKQKWEDYQSILNNDLDIVMTVPMIFNQKPSLSNLLDRKVDYIEWVRGSYNEYANYNKLNISPFLL